MLLYKTRFIFSNQAEAIISVHIIWNDYFKLLSSEVKKYAMWR